MKSVPHSAPHSRPLASPFLIFDTHPIQYRSPVFSLLFEKGARFRVFYFNDAFDGKKWWFHEVGKIPDQQWELSLRDGFPNVVLGTHRLGVRAMFRKLKEALLIEQPSAVLIFGYYLPEHWMLWWLCRDLRIPLVFVGETFQDGGSSLKRRAAKALLRPLFFRGISQFLAIGQKTHQFYLSASIEEERITDAKYCVDTNFFSATEKERLTVRKNIRASLEIPQDAFVCLFVGRLFERKRPLDMIALHQHLDDPHVYTILVGNGPLEDRLKEASSGHRNVRMVGFKNQGETRAFYLAADCLVIPSEYETWGLVANEALSCGTPVIVTETCGTANDLVVHGETGFVYPVGDMNAAAAAVRKLKQSPEVGETISKKGKNRSAGEFGVDQFSVALLNAINRVRSGT